MTTGDWKQMIDRKIQLDNREKKVVDGLDLTGSSPFIAIIIDYLVQTTNLRPI